MKRRRNPYAGADPHSRAAKAAGYPARSVFKLSEIDRRISVFRPGQRVLDLGAAPGSWALYAAKQVGDSGRVLAIDLAPFCQAFSANVETLQADLLSVGNEALSRFAPYDVVLSDMAPSTSGSKARDQARSEELFARALEIAVALGRPGSTFVGKLFMSGDFQKLKARVLASFERVQVIRPSATRKPSSEVFVVGVGLRLNR